MSGGSSSPGGGGLQSRKHIEFAKNLFLSWDDNENGQLDAEEIIRPLVALGLSSDSRFVIKLLQALDPNSGHTLQQKQQQHGGSNVEDLKISLREFIKIFKSDRASDRIALVVKKATKE